MNRNEIPCRKLIAKHFRPFSSVVVKSLLVRAVPGVAMLDLRGVTPSLTNPLFHPSDEQIHTFKPGSFQLLISSLITPNPFSSCHRLWLGQEPQNFTRASRSLLMP